MRFIVMFVTAVCVLFLISFSCFSDLLLKRISGSLNIIFIHGGGGDRGGGGGGDGGVRGGGRAGSGA